MYVFAKALHASGQDICFVRDRYDTNPFSQPFWKDADVTLPYEDVAGGHFDAERWRIVEQNCGWQAPDWLYNPLEAIAPQRANLTGTILIRACWHWSRRRNHMWMADFEALRQADAAIVCGKIGELMAAASGLPYVIWPHGGDIRLAAGLGERPRTLRGSLRHRLICHVLRDAFVRADLVGSHNPMRSAPEPAALDRFIRRLRFARIAIPHEVVLRRPATMRRRALADLLYRIGVSMPAQPLYGLIPSRVDYYWKGHDLFLNALARRPGANIHWFVSGWGNDYRKAQAFASEHRLDQCVTFLPVALSSPLLFELMSSVDICVDNFRRGAYGTAAVEAMAHCSPVMMRIDNDAFESRGWEPPPVLNARNEDDIIRILDLISSGEIDLEERGRAAAAWISRNHAPEIVVPDLVRHLEDAVAHSNAR